MQPAQRDDEIFDVVDHADRVIGQATRKEVHARGLLHRAVHILVADSSGRFFLQRRSLAKDTIGGLWAGACSGHLDSGEDYETAAIRELAEEIGVHARADELTEIFRRDACPETELEFIRVYALRREGPFTWNTAEIMDGQWVTVTELDAWLERQPSEFAPSFRHVHRHAAAALREWLNQTATTPTR